jgi:tetratricopeptide (TPR) repeat protein
MAKKVEHNRSEDILQTPEALRESLQGGERWVERHPKTVVGVAVAIALVVGGYFGYAYYKDNQNEEAQREMFQAVYYFEADSLELALNGDGNTLGFKDIIQEYGVSDAANLAQYYAGVCYLKQGKWELARLYLEDFKSNDLLVQARAYSLIGDSYMEEQNFQEAAKFYSKAADYKPNKFFTPSYLMKAALAFEKSDQKDKAVKAYDEIINKYWDSAEYQNARKYKALLDAKV